MRGLSMKKWFSAALVLGVALVAWAPVRAMAAEVSAIVPDSITVVSSAGGQVVKWETVTVTADWDVFDQDAHAGDTFSMELPEEFDTSVGSFPLLTDDGDTVGTCDTVPSQKAGGATVVCTLNDYVDTHQGVKGSLQFAMQATATTGSNTVDFGVGSATVPVTLPGGGGIGVGDAGPLPTEVDKWGWFNRDSSAIVWRVMVPASAVTSQGEVDFTDVYADGLTLDPDSVGIGSIPATDEAWRNYNAGEPSGYQGLSQGDGPVSTSGVRARRVCTERSMARSTPIASTSSPTSPRSTTPAP